MPVRFGWGLMWSTLLGGLLGACDGVRFIEEPAPEVQLLRARLGELLPASLEGDVALVLVARVPPPRPDEPEDPTEDADFVLVGMALGGGAEQEPIPGRSSGGPGLDEVRTPSVGAPVTNEAAAEQAAQRAEHWQRVVALVGRIVRAAGRKPLGIPALDVTPHQARFAVGLLLEDLAALGYEPGSYNADVTQDFSLNEVEAQLRDGPLIAQDVAQDAFAQCGQAEGRLGLACRDRAQRLRERSSGVPVCAQGWSVDRVTPDTDPTFTADLHLTPYFEEEQRRVLTALEQRFAAEGTPRRHVAPAFTVDDSCVWVSHALAEAGDSPDVTVQCRGGLCFVHGIGSWTEGRQPERAEWERTRFPPAVPLDTSRATEIAMAYVGTFQYGFCGSEGNHSTWIWATNEDHAAAANAHLVEACDIDRDDFLTIVVATDASGRIARLEARPSGANLRVAAADCLAQQVDPAAGPAAHRALVRHGNGPWVRGAQAPRVPPAPVSAAAHACLPDALRASTDLCVELDAGGTVTRLVGSRAIDLRERFPRPLGDDTDTDVPLTAPVSSCVREAFEANPVCSEHGAMFVLEAASLEL